MAIVQYRAMNENNRYVGESHPKARLTDHEVNCMRDMHERLGLNDRRISELMDVPRRTVRCILKYEVRAQTTTRVVKYVRPQRG